MACLHYQPGSLNFEALQESNKYSKHPRRLHNTADPAPHTHAACASTALDACMQRQLCKEGSCLREQVLQQDDKRGACRKRPVGGQAALAPGSPSASKHAVAVGSAVCTVRAHHPLRRAPRHPARPLVSQCAVADERSTELNLVYKASLLLAAYWEIPVSSAKLGCIELCNGRPSVGSVRAFMSACVLRTASLDSSCFSPGAPGRAHQGLLSAAITRLTLKRVRVRRPANQLTSSGRPSLHFHCPHLPVLLTLRQNIHTKSWPTNAMKVAIVVLLATLAAAAGASTRLLHTPLTALRICIRTRLPFCSRVLAFAPVEWQSVALHA